VQPTDPPDLATLPRGPDSDQIAQWITTWKPVHFRARGQWHIGVIRAWVHLANGTWIAHIDHAGEGMHDGWQQTSWVIYRADAILPVNPAPSASD
jgi:hypothetical protein